MLPFAVVLLAYPLVEALISSCVETYFVNVTVLVRWYCLQCFDTVGWALGRPVSR